MIQSRFHHREGIGFEGFFENANGTFFFFNAAFLLL